MSIGNNAAAGRIYGSWEGEADGTVIFISEQGRRIPFRYVRMSSMYRGATEYKCTKCPVTALMINAEFRIVDPCAGHDCSVGAYRPQSTPAPDATTVVSAQQSPPATALASRLVKPAKNAPKVIAKAIYDGNGCIKWPSERYPGITFTFRTNKDGRYFYCVGCARIYNNYTTCLNACGIKRRYVIVSDDDVIDCHPDNAGTNRGHLCQQPLLEEELRKAKATATDATTVVSAQQSPPATALASDPVEPAKNAPKVIANAIYDEDGCVTWSSKRYPGTTFTFRPNKDEPGRPRYFCCTGCAKICSTYKACLAECGISRMCLKVLGGKIVERHPDEVGTNKGHLCQQPILVGTLKKALEKSAAKGTTSIAVVAMGGTKDANYVPKIKVTGEPPSELANTRGRPLAEQPSDVSSDSDSDKPFGKILDVTVSTLTEAERLEWEKASDISTGLLRGRKLIAYQSQKHHRLFKFVRAGSGPSSLDKNSFDYYCLDCWINHEEECRVTASSPTLEFIITDPDRTSSGRHACTPSSSARPSGSPAVAKEPLSALADAEARTKSHVSLVVETPAKLEYDSERYQAKLEFVRISIGKKGQVYYACMECRTLKGKLKDVGYQRFGYNKIRIHHAIVVGGKFERNPDECGVELIGDTVECRHICQDDKLIQRLDVEPPPKRMRDASHGSPSDVRTRSSVHSVNDQRLHKDSDRISTDQRAGAQAVLPRPSDSAVDQATAAQATGTRNNEPSRQSEDIGLGFTVDALDASPQRAESTYSVSSTAQRSAAGSRADTPHQSEVNVSTVHMDFEDEQEPHRSDGRHEAATQQDYSNKSTPVTQGIHSESTYSVSSAAQHAIGPRESESNVSTTTSSTCSASKNPVSREPVENNGVERLQQCPDSAGDAQNAALAPYECDHLTVRYTPASGMSLNATYASAPMTFRDFRQVFSIPQHTQKVFIFKKNEEDWDVIRDDEKTLPVINGRVEAKAYSEN